MSGPIKRLPGEPFPPTPTRIDRVLKAGADYTDEIIDIAMAGAGVAFGLAVFLIAFGAIALVFVAIASKIAEWFS